MLQLQPNLAVKPNRGLKTYVDPGFEALHPRDEKGQFVEKAKVEAVTKAGKNWVGRLTRTEKELVDIYSGPEGQKMTTALRNPESYDVRPGTFEGMDRAIAKSRIPSNVTLYRGFNAREVRGLKAGAIFSDRAYVSTTLDYRSALKFARQAPGAGGKVIRGVMRVRAKKGMAGAYLGGSFGFGFFGNEFEMLLPRSSRFRIDKISRKGEHKGVPLLIYDATYLGPKGAKKLALDYQKDPEFEALHPRDEQGQFVEKAKVEAIRKESTKWEDSLSKKELQALEAYTFEDYGEFNRWARGGKGGFGIEEMAEDVDRALHRSKLPVDVTLYRGMNVGHLLLQEGTTFVDRGYVSTSLDGGVGRKFGIQSVGKGDIPAVFRIRAKAGQKGAYLGNFQPKVKEFEVLLPRNSRFRIDKISKDTKKKVVYVDASYLGQGKGK